jgi:ubiquinone/menaquinone biosynthesis C-methylase UbiE
MRQKKTFEEALEDNPLRPLVRDRMEILPLARASGTGRIGLALQVACARGDSTRQLLQRFDIAELVAVDKSEAMILVAGQKHAGLAASFRVMDIPRLDFPDGRFDAVFNLAELHNYADWREGLAEMSRVLKPGGRLIMDELSIESFECGAGPYFKRRTVHPYERMFSAKELRTALGDCGLEALCFETRNPLGLLPYLIIVAEKRPDLAV